MSVSSVRLFVFFPLIEAHRVIFHQYSSIKYSNKVSQKCKKERYTILFISFKISYDKKCHTTYTTDYEPQQEEECEENYKKNCFIEYKKVAQDVTVEFCHTPLVKDCNIEGPVECKTEYEAMCATR
jgi:hypothetical protein